MEILTNSNNKTIAGMTIWKDIIDDQINFLSEVNGINLAHSVAGLVNLSLLMIGFIKALDSDISDKLSSIDRHLDFLDDFARFTRSKYTTFSGSSDEDIEAARNEVNNIFTGVMLIKSFLLNLQEEYLGSSD